MSHISRIKTQMVEKEYLLTALKDAGYRYEEGKNLVDIKVHTKFFSSAIVFRKSGQAYECVADWMGVRGIKQQEFIQQITQRYAYHAARAKLEAQGFALVSEEVQEGNRIHLRLRRMA